MRTSFKRVVAVSVLAISFMFASNSSNATPPSWPSADSPIALNLSCPDGEMTLLPPKGGGPLVPARVVEYSQVVVPLPTALTHRIFVPYQVNFTVTYTDRGTFVHTHVRADDVKNAPLPDDAVTCSTSWAEPDGDGGVLSYSYTAIGVIRGKP